MRLFPQFLLQILIKTWRYPHFVIAEHWPYLTCGWGASISGASVCEHQWTLHSTGEEEIEAWGDFCLSAASLCRLPSPTLLHPECSCISRATWLLSYFCAFFAHSYCSFLFLIYCVIRVKAFFHPSHTKPRKVRRGSETIAMQGHRARSSWPSCPRATPGFSSSNL